MCRSVRVPVPRDRVDGPGGVVDDERRRPHGERPRQCDPQLLAAREVGRPPGSVAVELDRAQDGPDPRRIGHVAGQAEGSTTSPHREHRQSSKAAGRTRCRCGSGCGRRAHRQGCSPPDGRYGPASSLRIGRREDPMSSSRRSRRSAASCRVRSTSRCSCSTSASTLSKRSSSRAGAQLEPDRRPVDVAVEVQQVGLDPDRVAAVGERRVVPDADGGDVVGAGQVRAPRVDAGGGKRRSRQRREVGRRKAQVAAAPVAADDGALEPRRAAQQLAGLLHRAEVRRPRIREDDTGSSPARRSGTTSTSKPRRAPSSASVSVVPRAPWP